MQNMVVALHTDCLSRRHLSLSDNESSFSFSSLATISSSRFAAIAIDSLGVDSMYFLPSACIYHLILLLYSIDPQQNLLLNLLQSL